MIWKGFQRCVRRVRRYMEAVNLSTLLTATHFREVRPPSMGKEVDRPVRERVLREETAFPLGVQIRRGGNLLPSKPSSTYLRKPGGNDRPDIARAPIPGRRRRESMNESLCVCARVCVSMRARGCVGLCVCLSVCLRLLFVVQSLS